MAAVFRIIVAMDENRGIAKHGSNIPWHHSDDIEFFKSTTINQTVIMGRKTYESIGRVLPSRKNYILSRVIPDNLNGAVWFNNVHECIRACRGSVYIIGGAEIYNLFLSLQIVQEIIITQIPGVYDCNIFFPKTTYAIYKTTELKSGLIVNYLAYNNTEELTMLKLGKSVIGSVMRDAPRNVPQTFSSFGHQLKFDLSNNTFPLMTSRRLFFRGIVEELLLMLQGSTDSRVLESRGVNVWRGNTSREFLDSRGLWHMPAGDMGASYGWLARHFGAQYVTCETDYTGQGFDQINYVIQELKTNPTSRRLIISLWDPNSRCPLPPCLYNYQFYSQVNPEDPPQPASQQMPPRRRLLSCMMTQRSSDFAVAGGWNVAAGALLTYLIASVTNHTPHTLIWNIGDLHVYQNLTEQLTMQLTRVPRVYPKIYITPRENIRDFRYEDIELVGYNPHDKIDFPMAI